MINRFVSNFEFLSNFYNAPVLWDGVMWPTAEHAFQAAKAQDMNEREFIRTMTTPGKAKRMGRTVKLRVDWDIIKLDIMRDIIFSKFNNKDLKQMLIATGGSTIVEGNNWHDNFWGDCSCINCFHKIGLNNLGTILMEVRDHCQQ